MSYVATGTNFTSGKVKNYLLPGNADISSVSATPQGITFAQKTIIFAMSAFINVLPTGTTPSNHTVTVNLYKGSNFTTLVGAPFASCTFTIASVNPRNNIILQNFSSTFIPGTDFLFVEVSLSPDATNAGTLPLIVTLSSY